ncbi:MAG: hypothetical protein SF069_13880 [Phycisphaerae bacterium]|nr:hypothetical protein [Phycisphaerae bacterium]
MRLRIFPQLTPPAPRAESTADLAAHPAAPKSGTATWAASLAITLFVLLGVYSYYPAPDVLLARIRQQEGNLFEAVVRKSQEEALRFESVIRRDAEKLPWSRLIRLQSRSLDSDPPIIRDPAHLAALRASLLSADFSRARAQLLMK